MAAEEFHVEERTHDGSSGGTGKKITDEEEVKKP